MRGTLTFAVLLTLGACQNNFDPASYLDPSGGPRVLGVVATPPEVAPGATSMLQAIVAAPDTGAPVTFEWAVCMLTPTPGQGSTNPACLTTDSADFLVPLPSTTETAQVTMPPDETPQKLGLPDPTGGFYLPVRLRVTQGGQRVAVIYNLRLSIPQVPPNHNPTIQEIDQVLPPFDASPMMSTALPPVPAPPTPVAAGSEVTLRLVLTDDSFEMYPTLQGKTIVTLTESPIFLWYADAGVLSDSRTAAHSDTTLRLDDKHAPAPGSVVNLWVVAHDERGGTAFSHTTLAVQ
jgi:hypothetical protein